MHLSFWGTRGSIAVPGSDTLRYGGNTTCLEVNFGGGHCLIVDSGTGIRRLGEKLASRPEPPRVKMILTHLHFDHLYGFPFFSPVYQAEAEIKVGGWPTGLEGLASLFDSRQNDGRFPLRFDQLPSKIGRSAQMTASRFELGAAVVRTTPLHHPQGCLGLRFEEGGNAIVFITDNELDPNAEIKPAALVPFCQGAEVLIHDAQYLPEEMPSRAGWGHSDWRSAVELARMSGVGRLILTHHEPSRTDDQIDEIVAKARYAAGANMMVEAAYEGMKVEV
ncbi:MAG: MBL fold metallo-hydrolase [Desulfarculaceae bacterium]|jgi:phosphoribosyl 1,2-cyclic phosphodiesterase